MKQLWMGLCLIMLAAPALARETDGAPPMLAVALLVNQSKVELGGTHGFRLADESGKQLDLQWGGTRVQVQASVAGLKYKGGLHRKLKLTPAQSGFAQVNGKPYRGTVEIAAAGAGLNVINHIGIEPYLWGVVKAEISASAPPAALRAQAVAARTFAMRNKDTYASRGYGLKASEQSQVYGGVSMEDPRCTKAVNDTRGVVATFEGRLIEAQYHASCGGWTENNEDVWSKSEPIPYERSRQCWGCQNAPMPPWSVALDFGTIQRKLVEFQWDIGEISRIDFTKTKTGRVKDVMVHSTTGVAQVPGNNFRLIIDRRAIRSLLVDGTGATGPELASAGEEDEDAPPGGTDDRAIRSIISGYIMRDTSGHVLRLSGRGSGHGVGMCQWGARQLAMTGKAYQEILRTYYSGIELRRAY